jgi:hypothetical protein
MFRTRPAAGPKQSQWRTPGIEWQHARTLKAASAIIQSLNIARGGVATDYRREEGETWKSMLTERR